MRSAHGSLPLYLMVLMVQATLAPPVAYPARAPAGVIPDSHAVRMAGNEPVHDAVHPEENSRVISRLFLIPTAVAPGAGQGQFSLHELFFPSLEIGLTDRVGVTAGASLVPGAGSRVTFISPKFTPWRTGAIDLAIGGWYLKKSDQRGRGVVYGVATYGDSGGSLTIGTGWTLTGASSSRGPLFMGGFSLQLSPETDIISESIFPAKGDPAILTVGMRLHSQTFTAEIAAMVFWGIQTVQFMPLPWTSFSITL